MKYLKSFSKYFLAVLFLLGSVFLLAFVIRILSIEKETRVIKSTHFDMSYSGVLQSEAEDISKALEQNYDRVRSDLEDPTHGNISVFIHPTQDEFNKATGLINSKANGTSRGPLAFHLKYETWFNAVLPPEMQKVAVHEFTHCVQLNVLIQDALSKLKAAETTDFNDIFEKKFAQEYPQWFWEALSDYESGIINTASIKYGMKGNPTLKELNTSRQIYIVGYTIVEYFVIKFGKKKLPEFIKSYGNFEQTLGISEKQFESGWQAFVLEKYL